MTLESCSLNKKQIEACETKVRSLTESYNYYVNTVCKDDDGVEIEIYSKKC